MKIVFFGTPQFAADALTYLIEHGVEVVAVITKPDKPKGRSLHLTPTPVKEVALRHNLPVHQPELVSALDFAPVLAAYGADLFVVVAYGEIIKQHLLDMPPKGCINLHASLLPKFRGAAPIQRAIIEGEKESGATIIYLVKKMDAGDMIGKVTVPIPDAMTAGELERALCSKGSELLLDVIHKIANGRATREPQNPDLVTYAPKLELEDCEVRFNSPAEKLHNLVRGVTPFPGAWCQVFVRGVPARLKLLATEVVPLQGNPGSILQYDKQGIVVACQDQALKLIQVQLQGKKALLAGEFTCGIPQDQIRFES